MVGEKPRKPMIGKCIRTVICIWFLVFALNWARSQVTIVPGKQQGQQGQQGPARSSNKPKPKPKPKPTVVTRSIPTPTPVSKIDSRIESKYKLPNFAVFPQQFEP